MELGNQIRRYRHELGLSQDELADKVYVTRQTISNWENGKNYPDVKSLLLLSALFGVSLDILVKGDLEKMKEEIKTTDLKAFNRDATVFTVLFLAMILTPIPLAKFLGIWGLAVYGILFAVGMYFALRIEKVKKAHNIQTYQEIVAFSEGKRLDEIESARELGKRPYQKALLAIGAGAITLAVALLMLWLLG